jgi:hypothetical protein
MAFHEVGKSGLFLAGKTGADEPRGVQLRPLADPFAGESGYGGHIVLNAKEDIAAENWLDRLKANDVSVWVSTPLLPISACCRRSLIASICLN